VRLLGGISADRGEESITRFRSQKTAALFAYLCLHARTGREHGREELAALFWPDDTSESARSSLRVALSFLRRALEPPPTPADSVLVATRTHVRIRAEAVRTDVAAFEAALRAGDPARAIALYEAGGPFLPGIYDDWAILEQERLEALAEEARDRATGGISLAEAVAAPPALPLANSLPVITDRFFGREEEAARLDLLLLSPASRLITLTGAGGAGKTRLAVESARRLFLSKAHGGAAAAERFPGGIWFVPLAGLSDPEGLPSTLPIRLREAMGLPPERGDDPLGQIAAALAGRAALFLLDNLEQVADGALAALTPLLERLPPPTTLLATSRVRLGLRGERIVALGPLPLPEAEDALERLVHNPAVQLFVDRARAVEVDFALTGTSAPEVAGLVRLLDGLPLAIELTAAWANVLTPRQMRAQLEGRLDALPARRIETREGRHRSLGAAFQWCYDLLEPEPRRILAGLSVFRGGFDAEAVAAVCTATYPESTLSRLHQYSLLTTRPLPNGTAIRFFLPESLRGFAGDLLTAEARETLARRHADYYLALLLAQQRMQGTPAALAAMDRVEQESDNLRAAAAWAGQAGETELALQLVSRQHWLWTVRGPFAEARRLLDDALALPGADAPTRARADALLALGSMAYYQGDHATEIAAYTEGLALNRALGNSSGVLSALCNLGASHMDHGEFDAARSLYTEALTVAATLGDRMRESTVLYNLGNLAHWQRDLVESESHHVAAWAIRQAMGDTRGIAISETALGSLALERAAFAEARVRFLTALPLQRDLGDRFRITHTLDQLARAEEGLDRLADGVRLRAAAEALRIALKTPLVPMARAITDQENAALRTQLGDAAYQAAWDSGAMLTWEEAVALALG